MSSLLTAIEVASQGDITPQFADQRQLNYKLIEDNIYIYDPEVKAVLKAITYISWTKLISLLTSAINSLLADYKEIFTWP